MIASISFIRQDGYHLVAYSGAMFIGKAHKRLRGKSQALSTKSQTICKSKSPNASVLNFGVGSFEFV